MCGVWWFRVQPNFTLLNQPRRGACLLPLSVGAAERLQHVRYDEYDVAGEGSHLACLTILVIVITY